MYKPGQSGNPKGRPKGPSMKEWAKSYLEKMTPEERLAFIGDLHPETVWKMAEGNPLTPTDITSKGERIVVLPGEIQAKHGIAPDTEHRSE